MLDGEVLQIYSCLTEQTAIFFDFYGVKTSHALYEAFCRQHQPPLCFHPWWLDAVCSPDHWLPLVSAQPNGHADAIMPVCFSRYCGITVVRQPPFTAYGGPWLAPFADQRRAVRDRLERRAIDNLIRQLPPYAYFSQHFHPECTNWYPFFLHGFEQTTRYTFHLGAECDILSNIRSETRRKIQRGLQGVQPEVLDNWDACMPLFECTLNRHYPRRKVEKQLFVLSRLLSALQARNHLVLLGMRHRHSGRLLNVQAVACDQKCAGLILTGQQIDPHFPDLHLAALCELTLWAQARHRSVDLEGSMHHGVERVYRALGGVRTPYHQINKIRRPSLRLLACIVGKR